jgi:drug/metabolite transporter (DMT)-like permease
MMKVMKAERVLLSFVHFSGLGLLVVVALLHLQFALQALAMAPSQAVLVFLAMGAYAVATLRFGRHQRLTHIVFTGTLPLFIFSVAATFIYADESPVFAIIFGIAPVLSGLVWSVRRGGARSAMP